MNFRMTELRNSTSKKRTTKASQETLGNKPSKKYSYKKTDCHDLPSSLLAIKLMIYILRFLLRSTGNGDKLVTSEKRREM